MSLFQKSVLNKYLKLQDATLIDKAYKKYTKYFHNLKIQENILISKEEQFQQKFLIELFENIFGYTIFPDENYNLTTEFKNLRGAKKADGAILVDGKAICVIELKGTKTKDLESIRQQAFDYKSSHPTCKYIVTSNFEKIRFYIETSEELEEFNLFTLTRKEFDLLYLCLHKDNMLNNIPLKIKEASVVKEEQITKEFYNDYSLFKRELYRDLIKQNLKNPIFRTEQEKENIDSINKNIKLSLFKKSQKLIDRFLFIFFAEDSGLLPPNSTLQILENWDKLKDLDVEVPLYNRFKLYFKYLDTGREGTDKKAEIFAYNGGLFKPDAVLNSLILDDKLLYKHTKKLSEYDFNSQVDVNILGHIFENSLNEIESINAEIEGTNFDKQTSKRKKDGVFYTPKYITKYIVDNTVGKLCIEKKIELGIKEDDYFKGRKNRNKTTIIKLVSFLDVYRDWLLKLTICDPACGSGAFLNQALDFLIKEHTYIDELKTKLLGGGFIFPDIENTILEKNIFGVDLNEESVEIAKLSLWLRTAQPRRKLNNLNSNIKCGNSLIDSKSVAGDKAFKWENEFPQIFENGGFDVIIGNPPYVRKQGLMEHYPEMCNFYEKKYQSATANYDIYALFMEKCYHLINSKGIVSFILPHKFLVSDFGAGIRQFFKENKAVENLVHFGSEIIFKEASTYTCIIDLTKKEKQKIKFKKLLSNQIYEPFIWDTMSYNKLDQNNWDLQSEQVFDTINKLKEQKYTVADVFDNIFQGLATSLDAVYVFKGEDKGNYIKGYNEKYDYHFEIEKEIVKPFIKGNEISKYKDLKNTYFVLFPYDEKGNSVNEDYIKNKLPKTYNYLKHFENEIKGRERGRMNINENWYLYIYPKSLTKFNKSKIMTQEISLGCNMTYDEKGEFYHPTTIYSFVKNDKFEVDEKFYLGILNSKVMWFFLKNTGTELRGGYFRFKTNYLKPFPLPEISENNQEIIDKVNLQLENNKVFQKVNNNFQKYLKQTFQLEKLSKKLQNWYDLEFGDFIKEINKAIKSNNKELVKNELPIIPVLTKLDEMDWMDVFTVKKSEAQALQTQINQTDKEIDAMVYELYNLTEDEIAIIESS
ncbi:Eco57I restriction-modification methylase domain-containing protein [Tenacibaculum finnmarkense genomovar finnmarkense]|uniref:Eco57I restriction-modification methylase domain-containing protein n=1 Tax=Tenacibaculum finnmarkense TaxID=2781243 RepID=UPI001E3E01A5|nr:TaqI-like C-terminal specificity domain-containing protein [Tenacibaculum finnmarkense]MCD8418091.1 BREX-1 system adenine-specific DNA-methyltransferase PglX [Tenacibaculum finnmarkense genomovar finnmarkense]MCG8201082.1 Eco57I restriction-modification methylase domain-containing protein [Tenacibaculum finnmarkense genomovar finnmarkense]MCG8209043.1 Eco57I restriction-modification methylase domain-containing protein [Tenacibaculum finnmarkense genomovar finnmarkense]MCG8211642.1 Eco57I res